MHVITGSGSSTASSVHPPARRRRRCRRCPRTARSSSPRLPQRRARRHRLRAARRRRARAGRRRGARAHAGHHDRRRAAGRAAGQRQLRRRADDGRRDVRHRRRPRRGVERSGRARRATVVVAPTGWQDYAVHPAAEVARRRRRRRPGAAPRRCSAPTASPPTSGCSTSDGRRPGRPWSSRPPADRSATSSASWRGSHGCRVVGVAGSDEKCAVLTGQLGFDAAVNHRDPSVPRRLQGGHAATASTSTSTTPAATSSAPRCGGCARTGASCAAASCRSTTRRTRRLGRAASPACWSTTGCGWRASWSSTSPTATPRPAQQLRAWIDAGELVALHDERDRPRGRAGRRSSTSSPAATSAPASSASPTDDREPVAAPPSGADRRPAADRGPVASPDPRRGRGAPGRRLAAPAGGSTRPTTDKVREAVFNALASLDVVVDARVADLYAGSGALGIEALSRGAAHCTFVERDRGAVAAIDENIATLGLRRPQPGGRRRRHRRGAAARRRPRVRRSAVRLRRLAPAAARRARRRRRRRGGPARCRRRRTGSRAGSSATAARG